MSRHSEAAGMRGTEVHSLDNVLRTTECAGANGSSTRRMLLGERSSLPRLIFACGMSWLLLAALPASAKQKFVPAQVAVIENTGSTNSYGYKITVTLTKGTYHIVSVSSGGKDSCSNTGMPGDLSAEARQLFADLAAAMPLSALTVRHGMRSTSFGTRTYIIYKGQQSPDLTFGGDAKTTALKADVEAIVHVQGVHNTPRHSAVTQPQITAH